MASEPISVDQAPSSVGVHSPGAGSDIRTVPSSAAGGASVNGGQGGAAAGAPAPVNASQRYVTKLGEELERVMQGESCGPCGFVPDLHALRQVFYVHYWWLVPETRQQGGGSYNLIPTMRETPLQISGHPLFAAVQAHAGQSATLRLLPASDAAVLPDDVAFIREVHEGQMLAPEMDPGVELFKLKKKFDVWKREFKEKLRTTGNDF